MGSGESRAVDEALADHVIGCATLANIEHAPQEAVEIVSPSLGQGALPVTAPVPIDIFIEVIVALCHGIPPNVDFQGPDAPIITAFFTQPRAVSTRLWGVGDHPRMRLARKRDADRNRRPNQAV